MSSPLIERISPLIRQILQAPTIVPSQVSAKTVRKSLVEDHNVDKEELSKEKDAVKALILDIFQEMYPAEGGAGGTDEITMADLGTVTPMKKKPAHLTASQASVAPSSPAVPLVDDAKNKKRKREANASVDEDIARKLHQSLNEERSTRGTSSGSKRKKNATAESSKGKKSRVKSKAIVDDDDEDGGSGSASEGGKGKKKKKSKATKPADGTTGAAKGGFSKPMILSPELADVLSADILSRPQVVKQIWDYIKNHELQNPSNKRIIMCDEKLHKVFKVPEIDMFQMNKVLSDHLRSADE